jgi:hypothetical protein
MLTQALTLVTFILRYRIRILALTLTTLNKICRIYPLSRARLLNTLYHATTASLRILSNSLLTDHPDAQH